MNADDVFRYGHLTVLGCIDGLPYDDWEIPGVCGAWSVKDIIGHLASYELAAVGVFSELLGEGSTPERDRLLAEGATFNDAEVAQRRGQSVAETLEEYSAAHDRAAALLARIPLAQRRQAGFLPRYGDEYDLEDLIVYVSYGHKREHSAQIAEFCARRRE
jgi:hypothetical protein